MSMFITLETLCLFQKRLFAPLEQLFKAPEFVHKHLINKHPEMHKIVVDQVKLHPLPCHASTERGLLRFTTIVLKSPGELRCRSWLVAHLPGLISLDILPTQGHGIGLLSPTHSGFSLIYFRFLGSTLPSLID